MALTSLPMAALRGHAGQVCTAGTRTVLRGGGRGELEAANPKGKRGRYRSSVLLPPKIRLYFMGVSTALEEISKLALNSSV